LVSLSQNEYVLLIDVEESQRFSQDSHVSVRSSQRSEIEKNHPAPTILEEDEEDEEEFEPDPAGPGRPEGTKGRLDECKDRQMKDRSKDIFIKIVDFCNDEGMNMWQFLGIQGKRHYSDKSNKEEYSLEKGKMFQAVAEGRTPFEYQHLQAKAGLYLQTSLDIGRTKYLNLRQFLVPHDINLPNTKKVSEYKQELVPKFDVFLNGIWLPMDKLINLAVKQLFESQMATIGHEKLENLQKLIVTGCYGFDASGID
jgi:hypothetical protein